ncbi:hypothetical protein H2198_008687 [Neophaeococcomyces mojaviensis]|uniref:Uncharacterized protein n=1 Tax=Neophaeococcomyces mojaviensis TaxID=3383035 RepID=A0ACC2ZWS5_9EURO|nr:hypothetical protein H2198_008687 [Knufia sp. JES_112]
MSSFSSLVRKPGKVVAPKAAPRRNVPRRAPAAAASEQVNPTAETTNDVSLATAAPEGTRLVSQESDVVETVNQSTTFPNSSATDAESENGRPAEVRVGKDGDTLNSEQASQHQQPRFRPVQAALAPSTAFGERGQFPSHPVSNIVPHLQQPTPPATQLASNPSTEPEQISERNADRIPSTTQGPRQLESARIASTVEPGRLSVQTDTAAQEEVLNGDTPQQEPESGNVNQTPEPVHPRSRRKVPPDASESVVLAQLTPTSTPAAASTPSPVQVSGPVRNTTAPTRERAPSISSQTSEHAEAFQRIATILQSGFDHFRASQTPSQAPPVTPAAETAEAEEANSTPRPSKRRKRNNNTSHTIEEQAAQVVANATGNEDLAPRQRRGTPENAEEYEIEAETTKLGELCDDHKWGKKSSIEKEMAANWPEILRRRKRENEERLEKAAEGRSRKRKELPNQDTSVVVPQQVIVNGQIVVEERTVDNREQLVREANEEGGQVLEVRDIFTRVTQDSIAPKKRIPPGQVWDDVNTELFYQGLRMFGTDFKMISNMIPGKNRRQVKLKYNAEERSNWNRVKRALNGKEEVTLDQYSSMTGIEFTNVEDVYKQMEDEEKKIRAEDEERRRNEGIISQQTNGEGANTDGQADIAMPSIEGQDGEQTVQQEGVQPPSDRASTIATTGGRQTAQPPNKKKQTRKTNPNSKRGRQAANKRGGFEGFEERLGGADEVAIPSN